MAEDPELHGLKQQAKQATEDMRAARAGWGTSREAAENYLAAKEQQLHAYENLRDATPPADRERSRLSDGIEAIARNVYDIQAEIRTKYGS